jgi:hypothetical protein
MSSQQHYTVLSYNMSGIYREDRLLQLLPCVAGWHDHEQHLREGEGDGDAVRREDGQAAGPHTGLLYLRGWRQRRLQRRRAHAWQQRHLIRCGRRRMEVVTVRTEADGGGDPDRGTDGGGDPDGGTDGDRGGDQDGGADGGGDSDGGGDPYGGGDLDGDASVEGGCRDVGPVDRTGLRHGATSAQARRRLLQLAASYGSPPPVVMNRERTR